MGAANRTLEEARESLAYTALDLVEETSSISRMLTALGDAGQTAQAWIPDCVTKVVAILTLVRILRTLEKVTEISEERAAVYKKLMDARPASMNVEQFRMEFDFEPFERVMKDLQGTVLTPVRSFLDAVRAHVEKIVPEKLALLDDALLSVNEALKALENGQDPQI